MKSSSILIKLAKRFPRKIAAKYHDYVGKMVGEVPSEIKRILLCLDFDEEILDVALDFKPDIIFTHHPFIYGKPSEVFIDDPKKKELADTLIKNNICVYSFHTNFDEGSGGMNDSLAKALDLNDIYAPIDDPMMRIGYLSTPLEVHEFAKLVNKKLNINYSLLINKGSSIISKVGIEGGAGSSSYKVALKENCDIYISGDVPHHTRRDIVRYNYNYLDVPHEVEKIFIPTFYQILKDIDPTLNIKCVDHEKLPEVIK